MVQEDLDCGVGPKEKVFGEISISSSRGILKEAAASLGELVATWHGLRRGRTVDVVSEKDQWGRPFASLKDIFESGGWAPGSRALFAYLEEDTLDGPRVAEMVADQSDSE